jgi:hypothetical protein
MPTDRSLSLVHSAAIDPVDGRVPTFGGLAVVVTSPRATACAISVADRLGRALDTDVTVLAVQSPMPMPHGGAVLSPEDAELASLQVRLRPLTRMHLRVVVAPKVGVALAQLLPPESLVVVGGRRRWWWPTAIVRTCRALEALGHYVVFVDEARHAA